MTQRAEIAAAALFVGVGLAGMPLEPVKILLSIILCAAIAALGARFIAALAMLATVAVGYLQHGELRIALLVAAVLVGIAARFAQSRPRAATVVAAACAVIGTGFLLFG